MQLYDSAGRGIWGRNLANCHLVMSAGLIILPKCRYRSMFVLESERSCLELKRQTGGWEMLDEERGECGKTGTQCGEG